MELFHIDSYNHGYHAYLDIWEAKVNKLFELKREPQNKDTNAVAVACQKRIMKLRSTSSDTKSVSCQNGSKPYSHPNTMMHDYEVVGHVPKLMALWLTKFLKWSTNSRKVVVKGKPVNRGGGYGLEIPCRYTFEGDWFSIKCLKAI